MSKKQLFIVGTLMAMCVAIGVLLATDWGKTPFGFAGPNGVKLGVDNPPVATSNEVKTLNDAFVAVSKAVTPEVVSIVVTSKASAAMNNDEGDDPDEEGGSSDPFEMFKQFRDRAPQRGSGSGVVITPDGYILTNNHVVEAGTGSIEVDLNDGRHFDAKLIGRDSLTDLAVIKIAATDLPTAAFGNSEELQVGQLVLAVGNPLGLNYTVTQGIVSALGRGQLNLNRDREGYGIEDFIQTDAAINPGNSGGGLFNLNGALIGINSAIATRTGYYQGYGFAIPVNLARSVAQDLIDNGHVNRGYIGVKIANLDAKLAKGLGVPQGQGVLVRELVRSGAGEQAGLKPNDVILEVDGQKVTTSNHLQSIVAQKHAGQDVKLKVFRDGTIIEKSVKLKARDESEKIIEPTSNTDDQRIQRDTQRNTKLAELGMEVRPLDNATRKSAEVESGVVVGNVDMYGEAMNQGLRRGDVVLSVNRKPVSSPAEFQQMVDNTQSGQILLLQVKSPGGSTNLVAVEVKK
ncbi:MAG: Trypsin-like serine protease [Chlorobi bacterium]|nr:Trypsin-like serine protease [Chlorobiota bacterium]